jgi:outer membrane protein OmpA-like peptidoglycan-associated protein
MASSPQGSSGLATTLREGGFESVVSNPSALFTSGGSASRIAVLGQQLVSRIFGSKSTMVSDAVAKSSGVSTNSASRVLNFAAPLVMGVLSRHVTSQGLNATGVSNLLADQKDEISSATPPGVLRVLDSSGPTMVTSTSSAAALPKDLYREGREEFSRLGRTSLPQTTGGGRTKWLPWLLFALVALGLLFFLRGRSVRQGADVASQQAANAGRAIGNAAGQAAGALTSLTLPGGVHLSVPEGSISYNLATFLGSSEAAPRTFVFDHLNFESSSTDLTPESVPTVNALGSILKAYPNSRIQLAGYTDNTGDPQANRTLSLNRALGVRAMLINQGIGSERVVAIGLGEDHPVASNDTEDGRARNRRLELTVTAK